MRAWLDGDCLSQFYDGINYTIYRLELQVFLLTTNIPDRDQRSSAPTHPLLRRGEHRVNIHPK